MLSAPHHISSGLNLILSCYVNRCLTRGLFASVVITTTMYAHLILFMLATCPTPLFLLDFKILTMHVEQYSSLICRFLCPPVTASLLGPYNVFSTLSQAPSFCILTFNPLNPELNPICHLLVLLGDLTFMGPCIISIFQCISNKMQRYTVYFYLETALHVSGGTSTHHQERIQLYLQHLVFVTPLLLSGAIVAYATHSTLKPVPTLPR